MTLMTTEVFGLPRGRDLTRADLDAMPDDGHRYELIEGALVVTPAPSVRHQDVVANLFLILNAAAPESVKVRFAPLDVALADGTVLQPDLIVAPHGAFSERDLPIAPILAVEVLSPSSRGIDLLLKKDRLERAGCPHYWAVDPDAPSIVAWKLVEGAYREVAVANGDERFATAEPFSVTFAVSGLVA